MVLVISIALHIKRLQNEFRQFGFLQLRSQLLVCVCVCELYIHDYANTGDKL